MGHFLRAAQAHAGGSTRHHRVVALAPQGRCHPGGIRRFYGLALECPDWRKHARENHLLSQARIPSFFDAAGRVSQSASMIRVTFKDWNCMMHCWLNRQDTIRQWTMHPVKNEVCDKCSCTKQVFTGHSRAVTFKDTPQKGVML